MTDDCTDDNCSIDEYKIDDIIVKPKKKKKSYVALQDFDLLVIDKQLSYKEGENVSVPKKYIDVLLDRGYLEIK